jgi:hypothetical protein
MSGRLSGPNPCRLFGYGGGCCRHPQADERSTSHTTTVTTYAKRKPQGATNTPTYRGESPSIFHLKTVDSLQRRNSMFCAPQVIFGIWMTDSQQRLTAIEMQRGVCLPTVRLRLLAMPSIYWSSALFDRKGLGGSYCRTHICFKLCMKCAF